jgi:hypothetical protein
VAAGAVVSVNTFARVHDMGSIPFGGATTVFCGDMQQLLPVHRFAKDPAAYCIKMCPWWHQTVTLPLSQNVRAISDPEVCSSC